MRIYLFIILVFIFCVSCIAQNSQVKLLSWDATTCDATFNPSLLKERITSIDTKDSLVIITVNFPENCCVTFNPTVVFKNNKLLLLPYEKYSGNYCTCDCCFSIVYTISGLNKSQYKVYFNGKKIELSDDHYATVEPAFKMYKGKKINRTNKYGFKEGIWITLYDNGQEETVTQYPESSPYNEPEELWSKEYYKSGKLKNYSRTDTTQGYFEDGEQRSLYLTYKHSDTTFTQIFDKYDNKKLEKKSLEKHYATIFTSELNPDYKGEGSIWKYVYDEGYYYNGKPEHLFTKDTSYKWFQNGRIKLKRYKNGEVEFNAQGQLLTRDYRWYKRGPEDWADLSYALFIEFYPGKQTIKGIDFVRDEPSADLTSFAPSVRYEWDWDEQGKLINEPKNWTEELPWKQFKEIVTPVSDK